MSGVCDEIGLLQDICELIKGQQTIRIRITLLKEPADSKR